MLYIKKLWYLYLLNMWLFTFSILNIFSYALYNNILSIILVVVLIIFDIICTHIIYNKIDVLNKESNNEK